MPKRALQLRRERLTELAGPELARVAAGDRVTTGCATAPLRRCLSVESFETICSSAVCS